MPGVVRHGLAVAAVMLVLGAGCSDDGGPTGTEAGAPTSAPAATTTLAPSTTAPATTAPATTVPAAPAVAEAGGWRMVITAPTNGATIGPAVDLCYELTGTPTPAAVAFDVSLVIAATGTVAGTARAEGTPGRGSARVNLGTPDPRRYDMTIEGIVDGQRVNDLAVRMGVIFGAAPPAGCP